MEELQMKQCHSKPTYLRTSLHTTFRRTKRQARKRYKQEKLNQKQKAMYDKLGKNMNEIQARK